MLRGVLPSPGPLSNAEGPYSVDTHERLNALVSEPTAFLAELLGTLVLAMVVFAVTDERNSGAPPARLCAGVHRLDSLGIDLLHRPVDPGVFQPARDFGPRLFAFLIGWGSIALPGNRGTGFLTVYIIAPILGAILGWSLRSRSEESEPLQ